jgi:anaerobic magnesium-protoporphyrin IX monomethyl ester cyclase
MDVLFINPASQKQIYQDLAKKYTAVEPPTWGLLLAESCRSVGYKVGLLDACAEGLSYEQILEKVNDLSPRLLCFVVYGTNVNAGTTNMSGATELSNYIKEAGIQTPIAYVGSHVQALPYESLEKEDSIDIIFTNEGVYALRNLLKEERIDIDRLDHIRGIAFRKDGKPFLTPPESVVPQSRMDIDLPGYAWDLLPYKERPFDLYRAPMWHAEYDEDKRTPYAALQTSLGCRFACEFCMINIINRNDNDPIGVAGNYSGMRYWSPEFIIKEFDKLVAMGVHTIRIVDEMFLLNPKYYVPLCEKIIERGYGDKLRMWAYSRVDTIKKPGILELVRKAGIKWLCLGIESSDKKIRLEISKGKFEDVDIRDVVQKVHGADIEIMGNYMFGLPGDNFESMQKTLDLSMELCTVGWNAYAAMPLPGSQLYKDALDAGHKLPEDYAGYSFHAYNTQPLPTEHLTPEEVLKFRDEAWLKYHTYEPFLDKVENKFGKTPRENIEKMTKVTLKRRILGD